MAANIQSESSVVGEPTLNSRFWELATIALIYFVVATGSLSFASINPSATPIWPPTGLALGLTLLRGYRILPAIFAGAFAANAVTSGPIAASGAIAIGNTLEAFVGAFLIYKWANGPIAFRAPLGVAKFAIVVGALSTPISATIGVLTLYLTGSAAWSEFPAIWATWWLGDAAGAVLVTPAIVLWARDLRLPSAAPPYETILLHAFAIIVGALAFGPLLPSPPGRNALAFLAVLPLMWAALRRGPRDTSTVALILSGFAIWGATTGEGPFVQPSLNASYLLLASFIASVTLPTLALSAAVAARVEALAERDLAERAGEIGVWDWDLLTNRMAYSDQAKSIFGFALDEPVTYEQVRDATHPEDLPVTSAMAKRALDPRAREKKPYEYRIVRQTGDVRWLVAHGHAIFEGERAVRYIGTVQDITERKLLNQALETSNARLKLAMKVGRFAVWEYAGATDTIVGSPELNELLGFPRDQDVTTREYRSRYSPGEGDRLQAIARAAIDRGDEFIETEAEFLRPDGNPLWLLLRGDFIPGAPGSVPNCLGVVFDITERKQSEEHLKLVIDELNHRVKNVLAVIQSISAMTLRSSADPQEAQARFEERLRALARAHDILTADGWRGATIHDIVLATVVPHIGEIGHRLHVSGGNVTFEPRQALMLSMVLHELATNALKYGALSNERGRIELSWTVASASEGTDLLITWQEHGGVDVTPPVQKGFGLMMIERTFASEPGGNVQLEFEREGFRCSMRLLVPHRVKREPSPFGVSPARRGTIDDRLAGAAIGQLPD